MNKINKISILGSGWLGLPLAKYLLNNGQKISVSTRSKVKAEQLHASHIEAHVIDIELLSDNIYDFLQADLLIINITSKSLRAYQDLLSAIEKSTIKKVLFISSTSVYSNQQGLCKESVPLKEETNLRRIERLFSESSHFSCTILRFAGLIGPKRHPGRFFIAGKSIKDANAKVNLIHKDDCIGLIEAILVKQAWGEIFNGCADNHPRKGDYYTAMAKSLGYPEPICSVTENSVNKTVCNEKVKKQLNYEFIYPDIYKIKW